MRMQDAVKSARDLDAIRQRTTMEASVVLLLVAPEVLWKWLVKVMVMARVMVVELIVVGVMLSEVMVEIMVVNITKKTNDK